MIQGPKEGEVWDFGAYADMTFRGVGRNLITEQVFIWSFSDGGWLVMLKDEWYEERMQKTLTRKS